jgi:hypothetical protein
MKIYEETVVMVQWVPVYVHPEVKQLYRELGDEPTPGQLVAIRSWHPLWRRQLRALLLAAIATRDCKSKVNHARWFIRIGKRR